MATLDTAAMRRLIEGAERVLLTGPEDPDGDSIGACLALQRAIREIAGAQVDVAGVASFRYAWMPGSDRMIPDRRVAGPYDLVVVLDGDKTRLSPSVDLAFRTSATTAIVDHHDTTRGDGYTLAVIDRDAASTCEMVLEMMDAWGVQLDEVFAQLLYAGIIFDTGGFRYSNASASTHRMAARLLDEGIDHSAIAIRVLMERRRPGMALKARVLDTCTYHEDGAVVQGIVSTELIEELGSRLSDVEGIVETLLYTEGVQISVLLVERGPGLVKLSLRSRGKVDVARLAQVLHPSGGGHERAAGVLLKKTLAETRELLPRVLGEAVRKASAA